MAPLSTSGNIQPVRSAHQFDESALLQFLQSNVAHFPKHPETSLTVGQFGHGQSNPTFLLDVRSPAGEGGRFVLRKKPPGKLLKSAHAVDREYQVLKALNGTAVPVPKVMCLCTDASVIGTDFYVMEHVEGRIFLDPGLPEVPPPVRRIMYEEMAKTLAAIHAVDVDQVGLHRFGRRDNYCKRQVERWAAQYAASVNFPDAKPDPKMLALIDWLKAHVPEEDAGAAGPIKGLVHGDYRLDNLVFHPTEPRVIAVLDWELSTLGNQRSDLAYACLPYLFPTTYRQLYAIPKPLPEGIPQQSEYVQLYSSALGLPAPSSEQFVFYTAVSLFRAAAIFAGVYRRALQGNASSEHASKAGVLVGALADMAHDVIGRGSGRDGGEAGLSHAQQKYAPGGLPGVPTGHSGKEAEGVGEASHASQKYAPDGAKGSSAPEIDSEKDAGSMSHAQQKYAPGGVPGVPTEHFGKEAQGVREASHAQQKYGPDDVKQSSVSENGSKKDAGDLSHAQQKYAPGNVPGVPTGHFGREADGAGEASHASQKYAPGSAKPSSVSENGSAEDAGGLSHAQQKYAPGGLPGVPTAHFGKESEGGGEASHAQQKYAPGSAKPSSVPENGSEKDAGGLSHAQQKYAPGGLPGVPTGRFEWGKGNRDESHATQRYAPTTIQGVPTSSRGGQAGTCCCEGGCAKASLGFEPSAKAMALKQKLEAFLLEHIYPAEPILDAHSKSDVRWTIHPLQEQLKRTARAQGLWNLWVPREMGDSIARTLGLPRDSPLCGAGLTNLEYAHCCEVMGKSAWAPEVFNCSAPDTGNMEVLARYGTPAQQKQWLLPLLDGRIRSCFAMTEPDVASSDATNIEARIAKQPGGASYVLNGKKWWTSGAMDPRCRVAIFMGKTDPSLSKHRQQSMVLVDMGFEGVRVVRPLTVFGFEDAPHGHAEVHFVNVRVPAENLLLGEGRGFEIAQGRLGPGRLHHCMRLIGAAERGIELMVSRSRARTTFGKTLSEHGGLKAEIAQCRIEIEQARLLVLNAAHQLDLHGNKEARVAIAIAKVVAPNAALKVLDRAIQVHGGGGVCSDFPLSHLWVAARTLRIADGPDEVHLETIGRAELGRSRL